MGTRESDPHSPSASRPTLTTAHDALVTNLDFSTATVPDGISAHVTPCPSSSGPANVVHVVIHTTLTIPNFSRYYTVAAADFQPSYVALSDGSLLSPVFTPNLRVSESWLVMGGAFCMLFAITTCKSIYYCRTVDVRNKALFYMLSMSQVIGLVVSIFFVIADFDATFDCTATGMIKKGGMLVSTTLLMPGILGTKAYRCLSNAGFVVVSLVFIRAAVIAVSGIVLVEYKGGRRFTGTCETVSESPLLPISIALQFVESSFICMCFMWAVYRSYRSPVDHARLSLPVHDDETSTVDMGDKDDASHVGEIRRGWWDYVPSGGEDKSRERIAPSPAMSTPKDMVNRFRQWWTGEPILPSTVFQRKPSTPGELPIPQPRVSTASATHALSLRLTISGEGERPSSPPPPSVMERIIRYVPRAELLRNMLKNELLYTTFLTAILLVIAVVMWVGITQHLLLGANSWIMLDWVIMSVCTMHSFGRVAHRHERELWLQDPANWRSAHHAEVEDRPPFRSKHHPRRAWSPVSVSSFRRHRHRQRGDSDGPYSLSLSRYRSSEFGDTIPQAGPSRIRRSDSPTDGCAPDSRSTSVVSSPMPSMDYPSFRPRRGSGGGGSAGSPVMLPSPVCPSTCTACTPPHSSDWHAMLPRALAVPQSPADPAAAVGAHGKRSCSDPSRAYGGAHASDSVRTHSLGSRGRENVPPHPEPEPPDPEGR
ncbi:hypothetical protein BD413DRAFT_465782 [Trametes elegans]|nr:hypothetical protein BD413DRAFT_465782 [Trametes elegans]